MVRASIVLFFAFSQLCASEQIPILALLPIELPNRIAFILWHPLRETDEELVKRTTKTRELLSKDEAIIKQYNSRSNLNTSKPVSSYSVDHTHIYTTRWIEVTTKDEEIGEVRSYCEYSIIKIALQTGQCIRDMRDPLMRRITPKPKCIAISQDESQVALLDGNGLKIVDPQTKTERKFPSVSEKISSIHFNKQSTKLIAYEANNPLKYHLIPLVPQEKHTRTLDMSLSAYFAQHRICKELKIEKTIADIQ